MVELSITGSQVLSDSIAKRRRRKSSRAKRCTWTTKATKVLKKYITDAPEPYCICTKKATTHLKSRGYTYNRNKVADEVKLLKKNTIYVDHAKCTCMISSANIRRYQLEDTLFSLTPWSATLYYALKN